MHRVVAVCSFVGAWLLVVGPIYQAALELREQDIAEARMHAIRRAITPPAPVSRWWWLLPPVKMILERRRIQRFRQMYFDALSPDESKALLLFFSKATAWMMVAFAGLLGAFCNTWALVEELQWRIEVFVATMIVLLTASVVYPVTQMRRNAAIVERKSAGVVG